MPLKKCNPVDERLKSVARLLDGQKMAIVLWYFGTKEGSQMVEYESANNMKRTWVNYGKYRDWRNPQHGEGDYFLRQATQIKNIWVPYGE